MENDNSNKKTDWRDQLAFLDNLTQHPQDVIKDRELVVRLLLALKWTGNSYDSDTAATWMKHAGYRKGQRLYDAATEGLKCMGAEYIAEAMCVSGEYTFGFDRPLEKRARYLIKSALEDAIECDDFSYVKIYWDGADELCRWNDDAPFAVSVGLRREMNIELTAAFVCDSLMDMKKRREDEPFYDSPEKTEGGAA
tara:strand:+ start:696 stop:1280 length:585 start_codon:yes stop_codon:yes gene_type:complete